MTLSCLLLPLPQFLFVMAWCQGEHITAKEFIWKNLIPATIGNYIGGGICLATVYALTFGSTPRRAGAYYDANIGPKMPWAKKRD